jgi:hypothetical protein
MRGKLSQGQVTKVYQTDSEGVRTACETQQTMVKAFFIENDARFSQTEDTPPMQSPLIDDWGYLADTEVAENVLDGSYEPPETVDRYAKELIRELRRPAIVQRHAPIPTHTSLEEHPRGWKKTKEKLAEPSVGPSMAQVKSASQDTTLAEIDVFMRNLPYEKGFAPQAWQLITDIEILKKLECTT